MSTHSRTLALTVAALMAVGVTSAHAVGGTSELAATTDPVPTPVSYKMSVTKTAVPHGIKVSVYTQTKALEPNQVEEKALYWWAKVDGKTFAQYQTDAFPGRGQGEQFAPVFRDGTGKHHITVWVNGEGMVKDITVSTGR